MKTLGQFIVERRKELGLAGREVVAEVRNSDGKPIAIRFWLTWSMTGVSLQTRFWNSSPMCSKSIPTCSIFWQEDSQPISPRRASTAPKTLLPPGKPSGVR